LFKTRSKFGKYIDDHLGYGGQERVREITKISRETLRKVCNYDEYEPTRKIKKALIAALKQLTGKENIKPEDFWTF